MTSGSVGGSTNSAGRGGVATRVATSQSADFTPGRRLQTVLDTSGGSVSSPSRNPIQRQPARSVENRNHMLPEPPAFRARAGTVASEPKLSASADERSKTSPSFRQKSYSVSQLEVQRPSNSLEAVVAKLRPTLFIILQNLKEFRKISDNTVDFSRLLSSSSEWENLVKQTADALRVVKEMSSLINAKDAHGQLGSTIATISRMMWEILVDASKFLKSCRTLYCTEEQFEEDFQKVLLSVKTLVGYMAQHCN